MSKKLLSVVLALALVFSVFAIATSAIGGYGFESEEDLEEFGYAQTWALDEPVANGNTYTVNVRLTANYSVGPIEFAVKKVVSAGTLTLTSAEKGSAIPDNWLASVTCNDATGKVVITPYPTDDAIAGIDNPNNAIVAVLTYTASADAAATLAIDVDNAYTKENPAGTLIAARMSDKNVVTGTAICGQLVNATNTVTIGSAATTPPTLVAIDGTLGVVDTSRTELDANEGTSCDGYVYGYDPENNFDVSEIVEVVGDGTMNVVDNENGITTGTGAMIQVLDLDSNVVAEYVLIIFGDVNLDGFVDSNDASNIELHENFELGDAGELPTYLQFAADVNLDGFADSNDASNIELHENFELGDSGQLDIAGIVDYYLNN